MPRVVPPRFGIGEWYGYSFVRLTPERRREFATLAPIQTKHNAPSCPFQSAGVLCSKKGGICSLRLYRDVGDGSAIAVEGEEDGSLRVVCPHRFKQNKTIYGKIGETMLDTPNPLIVPEVQFLRRDNQIPGGEATGDVDSEDVGKIDSVLVHPDRWLQEENLVYLWDTAKRSWQIRFLTAFFVGNAYADERKRHRLVDPPEFPKFHAESFYRTYVQPKLKHVESRRQNKPTLLDSLSNAYLRKVFYPRTSGASFSAS